MYIKCTLTSTQIGMVQPIISTWPERLVATSYFGFTHTMTKVQPTITLAIS